MEEISSPTPQPEFAPDVMSPACPSRQILRNLTGRWSMWVLMALQNGTQRFAAIRRTVHGISERMLAETLNTLEADGMVTRKSYPVVPPHVEYTLTPMGHEAAIRVRELATWIETNLPNLTTKPTN